MGCDYVFFMQAERIKKMRMKRQNNGLLFRSIPGWGIISKRRKIKSRQNVAKIRIRDKNGRFINTKEDGNSLDDASN